MKKTACLFFFLMLSVSFRAQEAETPFSVNESTLIGVGGYKLKNTYLSAVKYGGWGMKVLNERMKLINPHLSCQQTFCIDASAALHPAGTARLYAGFVDYAYGLHYRFLPVEGLKVLAGGSADATCGSVYNTQNGNNPTALHFETGVNVSAIAIYAYLLKNYPLTFRYQVDWQIMGMLFSPHYGQSYYEIFNLGNTDGVVKFSSLHNKFAMRNYLTVDFPVGSLSFRLGYLNDIYHTNINGIKARYVSNGFMVGVVKEFISFGGKKLRQKHLYQSAYY